ncbi:MAG: 50S ribosomal protein L9 [Actinomycetota bacterium]
MSTKVVLQKQVDKLGSPGDVVDVADGYARNYLLPRGLAVRATKGMVRHQDSLKRAHEVRVVKQKGEFESIASMLAGTPVKVKARAGDEGKLFGSVTADNIADALRAQLEVDVDKRSVHLDEPIRSLGTHEVKVRLFADVEPIVHVEVVAAD